MKLILAVILFGLIGFGAFFLGKNQLNLPRITQSPTQTANPTANWKTITFPEYTLKIPPSWVASEGVNNDRQFTDKSDHSFLYIREVKNKTASQLIDNLRYASQFDKLQKRELTLGSARGTEYYGCIGVEGCLDTYEVIAINGTRLYGIDFIVYNDKEKNKNLYKSIISTLKFIE